MPLTLKFQQGTLEKDDNNKEKENEIKITAFFIIIIYSFI